MNFYQRLSAYSLGLVKDEDLPELAMLGLEEGYDSESLRILAGYKSTDNVFMLKDYFIKSLIELNLKLKEKKEALTAVVSFYAKIIVDKKTDTYTEFEKLHEIINNTEFYYDDLDLLPCYADYISIWEEKMGGLDFHTGEGLTKEEYIEKTEGEMRKQLGEWLVLYGKI